MPEVLAKLGVKSLVWPITKEGMDKLVAKLTEELKKPGPPDWMNDELTCCLCHKQVDSNNAWPTGDVFCCDDCMKAAEKLNREMVERGRKQLKKDLQ
jgi:hypothetical protein